VAFSCVHASWLLVSLVQLQARANKDCDISATIPEMNSLGGLSAIRSQPFGREVGISFDVALGGTAGCREARLGRYPDKSVRQSLSTSLGLRIPIHLGDCIGDGVLLDVFPNFRDIRPIQFVMPERD
jgi:hypothetical protein